MQRKLKRTLTLLLAVLLLCGAAPLTVGAEGGYKVGDTVEYGSYPQAEIKDAAMIAALNAQADVWQSYGYYSGTGFGLDGLMTAKNYMQHCDVTYDGQKYRGVRFTQYRPYYTGYTSEFNYQESNGYCTGVTYWFRYEPLQWRVLDPSAGLVLCETIIDSQPYNNYVFSAGLDEYNYPATWGDSGKKAYANNYAASSLRQWLNADFINTAFTAAQCDAILRTMLDNSAYSTSYSAFDSASTNDKAFLLSYNEARNQSYGFNSNSRSAKGSDYAKCQGLYVEKSDECSHWWLRSAGSKSYCSCYVDDFGDVISNNNVSSTLVGVRPALCLNLDSVIAEPDYTLRWIVAGEVTEQKLKAGDPIIKPADPVKDGYTFTDWSPEVPATMPAQDMTFTAQFTKNSYTVKWIVDDKTTTDTVAFGDAITKPADPVKEDYTFTGWSPAVPATMPAQDLTFTAQFKKNETLQTGKVRSVSVPDLTVQYRSSGKLAPVVTADEGVKYTLAYSGFDNSIISVDKDGNVTTVKGKSGTTTVTVTATDTYGNTAQTTCKVSVKYAWWQWLIRIFLFGWFWY